ncbi:hypothetical protein [Mesorhizobium ventifaucium]|uniref:Uncharacterized protein n=1 Tax=Mesorhizobium ventifaucium TaxID=666020 RepID=A0ABM9DH48_9HYPH|nr:hypothetical protein [Mesorhizobium ventifaucium]CAH2395915.1 conserved hypothetical protein [Mesorhizobium ventifaucium]
MGKFLAGLLAAMLVASAGRCWSNDRLPYKPIAEEAVRTASARLSSDILKQECMHGRRYPRSQIKSGFKRHFEELRLTIVEEGYTIVPNVRENNSLWTVSEMAFDAKRRLDLPPQFGCFGAYWLDDNPDW